VGLESTHTNTFPALTAVTLDAFAVRR
jgi:hypothetical protein